MKITPRPQVASSKVIIYRKTMQKNLSDFIDNNHFIYHHDTDIASGYGDSCGRTFMWFISGIAKGVDPANTKPIIEQTWALLDKSEPRRYWDDNFWPGKPGFMSRDNLFPAICALTLVSSRSRFSLLWRIFKRAGFLWNTKKIGQKDNSWKVPDFCGPLLWLIALKLKKLAVWYLMFPIYAHVSKKDVDDTSDDLNIQVALMTLDLLGANIKSTLEIYTSSKVASIYADPLKPTYIQAFQNYFSPAISPPLDVEWERACIARGWPQ